jgi:hypothetical protein
MRENRLSGLMRGGSQAVIGCKPSHPVGSCLLYTFLWGLFAAANPSCGGDVGGWSFSLSQPQPPAAATVA